MTLENITDLIVSTLFSHYSNKFHAISRSLRNFGKHLQQSIPPPSNTNIYSALSDRYKMKRHLLFLHNIEAGVIISTIPSAWCIIQTIDFKYIHEKQILKKIAEWPKCLQISSLKLEPHRIPYYLYDLVTLFHAYWNLGSGNKEYRFITNNTATSESKLLLLKALSIVIKNGMNLLGVSTPKIM
jgi:hypothetical protein